MQAYLDAMPGWKGDVGRAVHADGEPAGEMSGVLVATRLGEGTGASAVQEERTGVMTFRFNDDDSITVNGASRVEPGKRAPEVGDPQVRTVVGGTVGCTRRRRSAAGGEWSVMTGDNRPSDPSVWARLRSICESLPETSEKVSHGELAWSVGTGRRARQFATTWDHHHDDRNAVLFAAPVGVQAHLVEQDPDRYFVPPYVGGRGWVGAYLDLADVDWDRIGLHLEDAHSFVGGPR